MEIKGIGRPSGTARLTKGPKVEDNKTFSEVLRARISQTNPASSATGPDSRAAFLEQSEKVLGLLDGFAQALADPRKTLRDMEPVVRTMEGEVKLLETAAGVEEGPDRSLSQLMSDVSLMANVALIKFYRGDYV
jgi:hypothetical protein